MIKYIFETIEVPLVYAQKVETVKKSAWGSEGVYKDIEKPIGPFSTSMDACEYVFGDKNLRGVYANMNDKNKAVNGYRFFTKGNKQITFKNLNIRGVKKAHLLIRASSKNPHTKETILYNMNACGYENAELVAFNGNKSIMRVECTNIDCHEKMEWEYCHLTLPSYVGAKCEHCKEIYYGYSKLGKTKHCVS
ncbi:hypothetical protein POL82_04215 [Priestia aryabhattai]|uniref:hypothetical protein n=1 Tax=Priestia aryabhattai TaxID=412384 RepID=UPI00234EB01A|nr:hypothetical protein [Priestia aryabhattai]MDC7762653.1 hypothetical protein [Priestia aryabhattai]